MKFTHIVFDLDGTLIDTAETTLRCLQRVFQEVLGETVPMEELLPLFGIPCREIAEKYHVPDADYVVEKWQAYDAQEAVNVKPFHGVIAMLDTLLAQGYTLGLVTSRLRQQVAQELSLYAMEKYFSTIVCADDTLLRKPFPDPLLKYMERADVCRENILYIGDSVHDMQCAEAAGTKKGFALWGSYTKPQYTIADYHFSTPQAVLDALKGGPYERNL